jgi:uncharacterized lipoprotein YmbA
MKLIISATLLALALSACSSPTPVQYYPLPDSAFVLPPKRTQEAALLIILASRKVCSMLCKVVCMSPYNGDCGDTPFKV